MFVYWVARHLPVNRLSAARQRSARPRAIAGCLCLGDFLPNSARTSRGWEPRTNNPIPLLPDHFFSQVQIATEDSSPLMSESIKGALWYLPRTRISPDSNLISGTQLPSATPDQHISLLIHWRKFNQPHSELTPAIVVGHPVRFSLNSPDFAFYTVPTFYQPCRTPFPPVSRFAFPSIFLIWILFAFFVQEPWERSQSTFFLSPLCGSSLRCYPSVPPKESHRMWSWWLSHPSIQVFLDVGLHFYSLSAAYSPKL